MEIPNSSELNRLHLNGVLPDRHIDVLIPKSEMFRYQNLLKRQEYRIPPIAGEHPLRVVDIGANLGLYAIYIKAVDSTAIVHCVEPAPSSIALLRHNLCELEHIHVHEFALGEGDGVATLHVHSANSGQNTITPQDDSSQEYSETTKVDKRDAGKWLDAEGLLPIDILKIDTEGSEVDILESIGERVQSISWVLAEYHSEDDRRRIDSLLSEFELWSAERNAIGQGVVKYFSPQRAKTRVMTSFIANDESMAPESSHSISTTNDVGSSEPSKSRNPSTTVMVVTGVNSQFFDLGQGLIRSILDRADSRKVSLGAIDLGCSAEQRDWLNDHVDSLQTPNNLQVPLLNVQLPDRLSSTDLTSMLVRPLIPSFFPGNEIYVWIDADAWVQDWSAIDLFIDGAASGRLTIVPEVDRGSRLQYGGLPHYWRWAHDVYVTHFGKETADHLHSFPMMNSGVFAMRNNAPHWSAWTTSLELALQNWQETPTTRFSCQAALNRCIYEGKLFRQTELLPAWCNWTCHFGLPAWDEESQRFVEPYAPHTPIGIVHLTGDKPESFQTRSITTNQQVTVPARYQNKARR